MKMKKVGLRGEDVANVPLLLTSYFGLRTSSIVILRIMVKMKKEIKPKIQ